MLICIKTIKRNGKVTIITARRHDVLHPHNVRDTAMLAAKASSSYFCCISDINDLINIHKWHEKWGISLTEIYWALVHFSHLQI